MSLDQRMVVVVVGAVLLACHALLIMHKSQGMTMKLREMLLRTYQSCFGRQNKSSSPVEERIVAEMQRQRLILARTTIQCCSLIMGAMAFNVVVFNALGVAPSSFMQGILFFILYFTFLVLHYCPGLISAKTADCWYTFLMLGFASTILPVVAQTRASMHLAISYLMFPQIGLALLSLNMKLICAFNASLALVVIIVVREDESSTCACQNGATARVLTQTVVSLVITAWVSRQMNSEIRQKIEHIAHSSKHSAAKSLLDTLCDVVVELDAAFCVVDGAAKLAAVLLRSQSILPQGEPFEKIMGSEEDHLHFLGQMQAPMPGTTSTCRAFHVRMRDSCGNLIPFEVLSVQFDSIDEKSHHLVGLREFGDAPLMAHAGQTDTRVSPEAFGALEGASHSCQRPRQPRRTCRTSCEQHGTPADSTWEELGGESASEVSLASSRSSKRSVSQARPVHDGYKLTSFNSKARLLLQLLMQCNVPTKTVTCCSFHILVHDILNILKGLKQVPCYHPDPAGTWQCQQCGVMYPDAKVCVFCPEDGAPEATQASL